MRPACCRIAGTILLLTVLGGCGLSIGARRDRYIARGKAYLEKQDYARAILEFKNAAAAMPKDAEPYYQIGVASQAAGDVVAAAAAFRTALLLNPKHSRAQLRVAELMAGATDQGLLRDGENRLKALMGSAPVTPEMFNTLALTELKLGETVDAVKNLEEALDKAPRELSSSMMLARTRLLLKDVNGAEDVLEKACEAAPKAADPRVVLGIFYRSQNRLAAAEVEFQRALAINSGSGPAWLELAILQNSMGRTQEAESSFKRLSGLGEKTYQPFYALFLFQAGRRDEALREFERLANEAPEDRQARTRLVAAYRAVGRTTDAEGVLGRALKKNPKDLDALLQRGEMFLADAKYDQAEVDMNQVLHMQSESVEARYVLAKLYLARGATLSYRQELSEVLRFNPYLLSVRLELVQNLLANNESTAALETLNAMPEGQKQVTPVVVERNWMYWALGDLKEMRKGIDLGLSHERSTDLLVQDGLWQLRNGNLEAARAPLEEALKYSPGDLRALAGLNESYGARKRAPLALEKVKEYASRQPKSAPVQDFLGMTLLANGNRAEARAAFMKAKALDPQFVREDLSLIQLDVAEDKWDDAATKLKALLSKNGENITARLWLGDVEAVNGNYLTAMEDFRRVLDANPNNTEALNNLAYLMADHHIQTNEAMRLAQKALELAPADPDLADTMGWILYQRGLYPSAITYLQKAAANESKIAWKYHLAMAYAKGGDPTRARATLEMALKRNPNAPEAKVARDLVDQTK